MGQGHDNNLFSVYLVHERNFKCPTLNFTLLFFPLCSIEREKTMDKYVFDSGKYASIFIAIKLYFIDTELTQSETMDSVLRISPNNGFALAVASGKPNNNET